VLHVSNYVLPGATPYTFDNVLTNAVGATARRLGAKLTVEYTGERLFVMFGAAAYEAEGRAASRGFQSSENDQGLVGEDPLFPNATIYDTGRLFGDRAFAGKVSAIYRFPRDWSLAAIARYHDGQPFSRLVIVPTLNQGPDLVRAFASGGSRFTFTATLDVRLQKMFTVQGYRVGGFADGYNLTNRNDEVEERVVTGDAFRTPTAFQPPRTFRVGARFEF
jgi:outer membrane receptor protein involved in Fe transport